MNRIAAFVAIAIAATALTPSTTSAQDSSSCPPTTSVAVSHVGGKNYTLKISARNNCTCAISFQACATTGKACRGGSIPAGQSRDFSVVTTANEPKANFKWSCAGSGKAKQAKKSGGKRARRAGGAAQPDAGLGTAPGAVPREPARP